MLPRIYLVNAGISVYCTNKQQFTHLAAVATNYGLKLRIPNDFIKGPYPLWSTYFIAWHKSKKMTKSMVDVLKRACEHIPLSEREMNMTMADVAAKVENRKYQTAEARRIMATRHGVLRYHNGKTMMVRMQPKYRDAYWVTESEYQAAVKKLGLNYNNIVKKATQPSTRRMRKKPGSTAIGRWTPIGFLPLEVKFGGEQLKKK